MIHESSDRKRIIGGGVLSQKKIDGSACIVSLFA